MNTFNSYYSFRRLTRRIFEIVLQSMIAIMDYLEFTPRDISWKVRWRMKHDRNPLLIVLQDKYMVKEYAKERGVRTIEMYHVTDKPDTIPFDSLPDNYFIKANHGCKWNILCKDRKLYMYGDGEDIIGRRNFSNYILTREECVRYCNFWLNKVYSRREWAYRFIPPKIIVEEFLEQNGGGELIDYKCFSFHGKVKAVYVGSPTTYINKQEILVDSHWQDFGIKKTGQTRPYVLPAKPERFQEIIDSAERFAWEIDFVRVDLYDTTRGVVLGEVSVYPDAGMPMETTKDAEFNKWLGDQWILS